MERRDVIKGGLAALAVVGVGSSGLFLLNNKSFLSTAYAGDFSTPLPIPPLLENMDKTGQSAQFRMAAHRMFLFSPHEATVVMTVSWRLRP